VVVKPRKGYGSVNTSVVKSEKDLENLLSNNLVHSCDGPLDMMVESFVEGRMYHVDGLVNDGKVFFWKIQKLVIGFSVSASMIAPTKTSRLLLFGHQLM
jgi:D-alanine-D-alanine ligase-like ATP-grasp enzyme